MAGPRHGDEYADAFEDEYPVEGEADAAGDPYGETSWLDDPEEGEGAGEDVPEDPAAWDVESRPQLRALVERALRRWDLVGVGRRTEDWCLRDVLFSGLVRDPTARWFREAVRDRPFPAPWVRALHRRQLYKLAELAQHPIFLDPAGSNADEYFPVDRLRRKFRRLWLCPPCGVFTRYRGDAAARPCGRVWLCPWCNARSAYRLYRHALACVRRDGPAGRLPAVLYCTTHDAHARGLGAEPAAALKEFRRDFLRQARRAGVRGGLLIHTVGRPSVEGEGEDACEHVLSLLCLLGPEAAIDGLEVTHRWGPDREACPHTLSAWVVEGEENAPETKLRKLLFGTDWGWNDDRRDYVPNNLGDEPDDAPEQYVRLGWGAACLPPVGQLPLAAWLAYEEATHGRTRYRLFGTWARPARPSGMRALLPTPERLERLRQAGVRRVARQRKRRGLRQGNERRRGQAYERRQRLLGQIRPEWGRLVRECPRPGPKVPRWELIRGYFAGRGERVSERDIRWLTRALA